MPRKGENIYKRKDGRWEGRYIKGRASDGKAVYGYVYARTYREVKGKILDKRLSMSQPDGKDDGDECGILFGDIAAEWFQMIKLNLSILLDTFTSNKIKRQRISFDRNAYA